MIMYIIFICITYVHTFTGILFVRLWLQKANVFFRLSIINNPHPAPLPPSYVHINIFIYGGHKRQLFIEALSVLYSNLLVFAFIAHRYTHNAVQRVKKSVIFRDCSPKNDMIFSEAEIIFSDLNASFS